MDLYLLIFILCKIHGNEEVAFMKTIIKEFLEPYKHHTQLNHRIQILNDVDFLMNKVNKSHLMNSKKNMKNLVIVL